MAGRDTPRTVLAHLIQRRNQTYSEIVAEFVELGGTITERHLRRLASGERPGTTPQTRRTLQRMFGKPVEAQDLVFALLESRQRPEHLRQLYFLGGVTGGLLAKASHDLGNPHAALTQARTAFMCADNADHHGLRAWVRGLQSLVSYWAG